MTTPEPSQPQPNGNSDSRSVIGLRTALVLYAALLVAAAFLLKGNARLIVGLLVIALAAKSVLHYLRSRLQ